MKRSYLGSVEIRQDYWTNGRSSNELKKNETYLYAEIDCCQEYIGIAKSQTEAQIQYNKQDLYYLCLVAISMSADDEKLYKYGVVIGNMISEGKIYRSYASIEDENNTLSSLVDDMAVRVSQYNEIGINPDFMSWYADKVMALNYGPQMNGVGSTNGYDSLSADAKESGLYWLYLLNTAEDVYEGGDVQTLREKVRFHEYYLNWVNSCEVNVSSDSILANARAGIIAKTGMTPEEALKSMKKSVSTNGLGEAVLIAGMTIAEFVTLLSVCASILGALVVKIIKAVGDVRNERAKIEAQNYAPDNVQGAKPSPGDYGYDRYIELMDEYNEAIDKLDFYEGISDPTLIGGTIGFWTLVFGAAIISNRKKK